MKAGLWGALACALAAAAPAQAEIAEPHVPGEVIVQFERGASGADRAAARDDAGTKAVEGLGSRGLQLVEVADDGSVERTIRELEADPAVKFAEPNFIDQLSAIPDDPEFGQLWGLHNTGQTVNATPPVAGTPDADIDAPEAWDIERGSANTVIAVMDSGIDPTHPDLGANLWENTGEVGGNGVDDDGNGFIDDVRGYDFVDASNGNPEDEDGNPFDAVGHGTHVSGTVAGVGGNGVGVAGVSQRAQVMSLRVCGVSGCDTADQIQAINYAAANGARVLNASLGGFSSGESLARRSAIFSHPEVLHVFAAGNEGANADNEPSECVGASPCRAYPCAHAPVGTEIENVICVAATNQNDARPTFSNIGPTSVDLGAPGTNVLSANAERQYRNDALTSPWGTNVTDINWQTTAESPIPAGNTGITDSPGADYAINTIYGTASPNIPVAGAVAERGCFLSLRRSIALPPAPDGDRFRVTLFHNATAQLTFAHSAASNSGMITRTLDFPTSPAAGNLRILLRLVSENDGAQANGVHVDNAALECGETPGPHNYDFKNGTSMASPHVAGAAGLLISRNPAASITEIRQKLLSTVDPNPALTGVTTTGGRLNIGRAVGQMPADTSITGGPGEGEEIATNAPSFDYSSNDSAATFQCSIDGGQFTACASGGTLGPLTPGAHALAVRSVDPRGNADTTPATRSFAVESRQPVTTIDKGPKRRTKKRKATFAFSSDEPGSTFECKVDKKPFADCASPRRLKKVKVGKHVFQVRAIDAAGNVDATADRHRWRVKRKRRNR